MLIFLDSKYRGAWHSIYDLFFILFFSLPLLVEQTNSRVQELCGSRGGRLVSPSLIVRMVFVDVKQHWTWTQRHRVQELCESRGGRPGLPVPNSPYGLCGHKATFNLNSHMIWLWSTACALFLLSSSVQFKMLSTRSVKSICALPCLSELGFFRVVFETVPTLVWLKATLNRPFKGHGALPLSTRFFSRRSMVWFSKLSAYRQWVSRVPQHFRIVWDTRAISDGCLLCARVYLLGLLVWCLKLCAHRQWVSRAPQHFTIFRDTRATSDGCLLCAPVYLLCHFSLLLSSSKMRMGQNFDLILEDWVVQLQGTSLLKTHFVQQIEELELPAQSSRVLF